MPSRRYFKKPDNAHLPTWNARRFTWTGNVGVAEWSSFDSRVPAQLVWSDAVDGGFYVVSPRTGAKKLFTFVRDIRGDEGEFAGQVFASIEGDGFEIHIIND